jgi:creatinine amidohydrolase/Fe(II)-dependent formamide hydrolase-like protein
MLLAEMTWLEVEQRLQYSTGIIVPIGSIEQHGPTGLIGTDAMCAEAIAQQAGERGDILIGPTLPIGMAQSHLAFPGTISLKPATLMAVVADVVASLTGIGFSHILFLNGHGGNITTISTAISQVYAEHSSDRGPVAFHVTLRNWFDLPGMRETLKAMYPTGHGSHATPSEISITQHICPQAIKTAECDPQVAPDGTFRDAEDFRRRYPDGRKGSDPTLAKPEDGARLLEAAAEALVEAYGKFVGET